MVETDLNSDLRLTQFDELVRRYPLFLRGQKGLSDNTVRVYLADIASFREFLIDQRLEHLAMDRFMVRNYLAWLATVGRKADVGKAPGKMAPDDRRGKSQKGGAAGFARVSMARKLTVVRSFYRFLVQEGLFQSTPVPSGRSFRLKVEKPLPGFLGKSEMGRLLEAPVTTGPLGIRDRAILEILYSCGIRLAEIHGLNANDLQLERREILVRGKGNKERWVVFGKPTETALVHYLKEGRPLLAGANVKPEQALFLNRYGKRLSRRSFEILVRRYAAQAGTRDGVHPHTLRHTFATHMLEGGADLRIIQELLGHSSPTTTQIYTHVTKREALAAYMAYDPRSDIADSGSSPARTDRIGEDASQDLEQIQELLGEEPFAPAEKTPRINESPVTGG